MPVYDLQNPQHLENDLNNILSRLNEIYYINIEKPQIEILPKLLDKSDAFWASEDNNNHFNTHIPTFKNLHKDMYSFIESFTRLTLGDFDPKSFETKYDYFSEFRLLNNMFKHPGKKWPKIKFVKISHIETKQYDLWCNFTFKDQNFKTLGYSVFCNLVPHNTS